MAEQPAEKAAASVIYATEAVTVIHGDARDVLPEYGKESFDLVLTDPPYGQDWQSNRRTEQFDLLHNDGASDRDGVREVLVECVRLVGQNRHLYVFGPSDVLEGLKVSETADLVWDKTVNGTGNLASPWAPQHEPITFAVSKFRHAGEAGKSCLPVRMRKGSVLRYPRPTGRKVRGPSEKPVPLLRDMIESSTRQGDLILDPFGGVCSTAVAAVLMGRRAVVVDTDRRWLDVGIERIAAAEAHYEAGRWL